MHLPELPTEFYNLEILQLVGSKLGKLLKVDTCTTTAIRGRYARICIEVALEKPLKTHIHIDNRKQAIQNEGLNLLRTDYGRYGHASLNCSFQKSITSSFLNTNSSPSSSTKSPTVKPQQIEWQTVNFPRRNNNRMTNHPSSTMRNAKEAETRTPPAEAGKFPIPTELNKADSNCNYPNPHGQSTKSSSNHFLYLSADMDTNLVNNDILPTSPALTSNRPNTTPSHNIIQHVTPNTFNSEALISRSNRANLQAHSPHS